MAIVKRKNNWDKKHSVLLLKVITFAIVAIFFGIRSYNLQQNIDLTNKIFKATVTEYNNKLSTYENIIAEKTRRDYLLFAYSIRYFEFTKILNGLYDIAQKYQISPYTILSLCAIESDFNSKAVSSKGAYGLLQITYEVWKNEFKLTRPEQLFDIDLNIQIGGKILKDYLDECDGDVNKALFMYNNGYKGTNHTYVPSVIKSKYSKEEKK